MNYHQPFESSASISGNRAAFMQSLGKMLSQFGNPARSSVNKENSTDLDKFKSNKSKKEDSIESSMPSKKRANNSFRLKYWEIDERFACPIAGICIALSEQRQLLKKAGISMKNPTLFEIHEVLVASSSNENSLSRKIDSFLSRKFSRETKFFDSMSEDKLREEWKSAFKSGGYTPIFWYLVSRPNISKEFLRDIFGDIHMSMHMTALERAKITIQIKTIKEQKSQADQKAISETRERKFLEKQIKLLNRDIEKLKEQLIVSERKKADLMEKNLDLTTIETNQNLSAEIEGLKKATMLLTDNQNLLAQKVQELEQQTVQLESENRGLSDELSRKSLVEADFQKEIEQIMSQLQRMNNCDKSCPSFNLCKKRVLIVGGISRMESLYRQVVELNGGLFEYHDGYMKGGTNRLECSFKRADIVLCPVNCNSHAACSLVKQLGKKHNKPVQMLSGSGLNAIFNGIKSSSEFDNSDIDRCSDENRCLSCIRGSKSI
ncbi:MAG: DUF2325 domain-containing protein [Desulfamplus sp.]